jgi:hypothetical protein
MSPTAGEQPASAPEDPDEPEAPPPASAVPALPKVLPGRTRPPRAAIAAGLGLLAVGLVVAVVFVMRNDDGGTTTAGPPATTGPSPPPTKGQIDYSCRVMTNSSVDAITAINTYVDAFNATGEEQARLADAAVGQLDASVRRVEGTFGPVLPRQLRDALKGYTAAAREASGVISRRGAEQEFNTAVDRLNSTKDTALDQCDAFS